jgi:hypothetical protein
MNYLDKWKKKNIAYYQDITNLYKFFIPPNSDVLEVGSQLSYLLHSLQPKFGLGIDSNSEVIEVLREKFPELKFKIERPEHFQSQQKFDYILLANTVSYLDNIQQTFLNLHNVCKPTTKMILIFHNPGWEIILRLASFLKQRMPVYDINWLNYEDINNLLNLEGFEVISHGKRMLFPRRIPLLFSLFNKILAPLPIINRLCLTEYVIARPKPRTLNIQENSENFSCSVIIPARNEAGNIESCITRMPRLGKHTEIIFIEGHSNDNTWEEIQRVKAK